jgi:hypothetical protein
MAGELAESEAEGEAQDVVNLASEAEPSTEGAPLVEGEQQQPQESSEETAPPAAEATTASEDSEEAAAEPRTEPQTEHQS